MRKAIQLKVTLWIEGEDEPAHDFAAYTIRAVQEIIAEHARLFPGLKVTIRKIVEESSDEEDAG